MKNEFVVKGEVAEVFVKRKNGDIHTFLVDKNDLVRIHEGFSGSWVIDVRGGISYIRGRYNGNLVYLHRFLMDAKKGEHVDHVNVDTMDNRMDNLRIVTQMENNQNLQLRKNNKTGYRGVSWDAKRKKYVAQVSHDYKGIFVGYFDCKTEAGQAAAAKRRELGFLTSEL